VTSSLTAAISLSLDGLEPDGSAIPLTARFRPAGGGAPVLFLVFPPVA
jgi:hypothetical protein